MSLINSLLSKNTASAQVADRTDQPEFTLKPDYRINETPEAWTLVAHLPGVAKDGLEVTAENGVVSLRARRQWQQPAGWTSVHRESYDAGYALTLQHDNTVDAGRIRAELRDGVLRVSLPKVEAVKPRKINVN
jgi:HSP20 family molecular chaperone IbpA